MRNLFDDIGSAKHNLTQKLKASMDSGSTFEINGYHLRLMDTISEGNYSCYSGGYGYIIRCQDVNTGQKFVLKKSVCHVGGFDLDSR
jgi:hypothetical protein